MCSSAPSAASVALPLITTYSYGLPSLSTVRFARGSRSRFVGHLRPRWLLMATWPSSTLSQTIVVWTEPSALSVDSTAWLGFVSSSLTAGSLSSAIAETLGNRSCAGSPRGWGDPRGLRRSGGGLGGLARTQWADGCRPGATGPGGPARRGGLVEQPLVDDG